MEYSGDIPVNSIPLMYSNPSEITFVEFGNTILVTQPSNINKTRGLVNHSGSQSNHTRSMVNITLLIYLG